MTDSEPGIQHRPVEIDLIASIDRTLPVRDGHVVAPASLQARRKPRIRNILPGDWSFASRISAPFDEQSGRVILDTNDLLPEQELIRNLYAEDLDKFVAVLRVLRGIGNGALSGFVIDYRRVVEPYWEEMGLGPNSDNETKFFDRQIKYSSEVPLGVLFADEGETVYVGDSRCEPDVLYLARQVDTYAHTLKSRVG